MLHRHRRPLLGLTYLAVLALLVAGSIQAYRKALPWQSAATVTLTTTTPGLQLNPRSDVKLQGLRVGEVRRVTSDGQVATVEMALEDDKLRLIPANVDAAIVPKTLFGEKFVDLRLPAQPVGARLAAGGVIEQSTTSVEIGALFTRLVPVLHALKPEQLSTVLTETAAALDGRGETLARTLNQLTGFLREVDPHLDTFDHDLKAFADTADIYAASAPDLIRLLASSAAISRELLVPKEQRFSAFLDEVVGFSEQATTVLRKNTERIVRLSGRQRPLLALLAAYSSSLPCTISGLRTLETLLNQVVGAQGPFAPLTVDMVAHQKPYVYPQDLPSNPKADANNNNLPKIIPNWQPHCPQFSAEVKKLTSPAPYSQQVPNQAFTLKQSTSASTSDQAPTMDSLVFEAREALARATAATLLGVPQDQVPSYAGLLLDPLLSDGEVRLP